MVTFPKVVELHLKEYLPEAIKTFGHVILHGDGNMYVDVEDVEEKHQRSYIAKTYAGVGNEAAMHRIKFTSIDQIPKSLQKLEQMFLEAKAKENYDENKIEYSSGLLSIGKKQAEEAAKVEAENETLKAEKAEAEQKAADAEAKNAELLKQIEALQKAQKPAEKPAKTEEQK